MSDLTRQLRDEASYATCAESVNADVLREAADALEAAEAKLAAIDALLADSSEREPTLGHYDDGWHDALYAVYLAIHPKEEQ